MRAGFIRLPIVDGDGGFRESASKLGGRMAERLSPTLSQRTRQGWATLPLSVQFRVLRFGLLPDGNVGIGVFP
jgi:hypothetical protein